MTVLSASKLALAYADVEIFSGINLEIPDNARIGLVGPNGAGKTSLLKVIVGELEPDSGSVHRARDIRIGYVPQSITHDVDGTLRDEIMTAFDRLRRIEDDLASSARAMSEAMPGERKRAEQAYSSLLDQFEASGGYNYLSQLEQVAAGVGLSQESLDSPAASASGGERTRAALARALLSNPDLLVLDEPTNYLDLKGMTWLERMLSHYPKTFLLVSHDRFFLDRVVNQIWEMEHERLQSFAGNYTRYRTQKGEQTLWQRRRFQRQQEFIAREEDFIRRYGAGQRAREAKGREKRLLRLERYEAPNEAPTIGLSAHSAGRTEQVVLRTEKLKLGFQEKSQEKSTENGTVLGPVRTLFSMPDIKLERGSRTALIGNNGAGKTTLIKTLLGLTPAVAGTVHLGQKVNVGYFRQEQEVIPAEFTVFEALLDARDLPLDQVRPYLARFLFRGDEVFQLVGSLSGGERSRLALARVLITQPNLLVLDEPTTHLDIATREALEKVLMEYDGTILLVSHDRHLVSLMAQQLWIVGEGDLQVFPGTFKEWEQKKLEDAEPPPKAVRDRTPRVSANSSAVKKKSTNPRAPDLSQVIANLEAKLAELERQLEVASENQDVNAIARLGEEHNTTRLELEQRWQDWTE
jgi:ATP-binding cassette subfamily F protein 3